jgi:hypothetical protein
VFWLVLVTYVLATCRYLPRVYAYGFWLTYGATLVAGAGAYIMAVRLWEHRWVFPLSGQYASWWISDAIVLCLLAGALSIMMKPLLAAGWHEPTWWKVLMPILAIGAGLYFHFAVDRGTGAEHTPAAALNSPAMLWHGFGTVPAVTYFLLKGAPGLFVGARGFRAFAHLDPAGVALTLGALLCIITFFFMYEAVDLNILHSYPWGARGWYDWSQARLTHKLSPERPGYMFQVLFSNWSRYLGHEPVMAR